MNVTSYFGVAIVVIALALTIGFVRKKAEKNASGTDRMNFTLRPPKMILIVSIVCAALFGLVFIILLVPPYNAENLPMILLALGFMIIAACFLYYSLRWKLVVAEDVLMLTPLFGKKLEMQVRDITHIETRNANYIRVYSDDTKLFSAPGLSQGGSKLVSYFIEKGVRAPSNINWPDNNWY